MSYNGWKNYNTWNVALWIQNDEGLYNLARECGTYMGADGFVARMQAEGRQRTADGVAYDDPELDLVELEEMMEELSDG